LRGTRRPIRIMACSGWKKRNRPPFPVERTAGYATCSAWSIGVLMRELPAGTRVQRIRSRIYFTLSNGTIIQRVQRECNRLGLPQGRIRHRKVGCNATVMAENGTCVRCAAHFRRRQTCRSSAVRRRHVILATVEASAAPCSGQRRAETGRSPARRNRKTSLLAPPGSLSSRYAGACADRASTLTLANYFTIATVSLYNIRGRKSIGKCTESQAIVSSSATATLSLPLGASHVDPGKNPPRRTPCTTTASVLY
jgi:hypothetical protein